MEAPTNHLNDIEFLDMCIDRADCFGSKDILLKNFISFYEGNPIDTRKVTINPDPYTGEFVEIFYSLIGISILLTHAQSVMYLYDTRVYKPQQIGDYLMTKKIIETPVVLTELQEPIAVTKEGVELAGVIDETGVIPEPSEETLAINKQMKPAEMPVMETIDEAIKRFAEPRVINAEDIPSTPMYEMMKKNNKELMSENKKFVATRDEAIERLFVLDKQKEIRLNELEARIDYNDRRIAVLMKDREAYIRLMHGRMNNEVGLQAMINGWEDI